MENWRPVVGFEGYYEVSDLGRVRTVKRGKGSTYGAIRTARPDARSGYLRLTLKVGGVSYGRDVHTLVAEAFLDRPPGRYVVDHKNCDRADARLRNLQYMTVAENIQRAHDGHRQKPLGTKVENRHLCRLSDADVRRLRAAARLDPSINRMELARKHGVSPSTITNLLNGVTYNRLH